MKQIKIFAGLGALLAFSLLPSCSNDLSDTYTKVEGLQLAKAPEITAWSGNHYFNSNDYITAPAVSTRVGDQTKQIGSPDQWDYDSYSAANHHHDDLREIFNSLPEKSEDLEGAIDITTLEQNYSGKEGEIFYIPEGTKGLVELNNVSLNNGNNLYNFGEITGITGIGWNGDLVIYNIGSFENFGNFGGSRKTVYNVGSMTVTSYSHIGNLYNEGELTLERNHSEYNENIGGKAAIESDMSIISLTGIKMPDGALYEGNADIHGVIESEKDVEFQTSKERYVCGLIVNGNLKVTAGTFRTGYVIANNLEFEGEHIWLLPDAYIKVLNELQIKKDGCEVYCANNSQAFIKTKDVDFLNKNNFIDTFSEGIYFSVTGKLSINMELSTGGDATIPYENIVAYLTSEEGQPAIPRFNYATSGQAECGEPWQTSEEDMIPDLPTQTPTEDPCPNKKADQPGSGCPHDGTDHNEDENHTCQKCIDEGISSDCNPNPPCPNHKCEHDATHHKGEGSGCDLCPEDEGCNETEDSGDSGNTGTDPDPNPNPNPNPNPGPNQPNNPATPSGVTKSEVEVNLSINDEHENYVSDGISDLVAKLSIHVRYPGDVEIFIPIPKDYYVDNDDLVILNTHEKDKFVHGGPTSVTYNVGGVDVTLTLTYGDDGITVTTDGINDAVFNYCKENYGDGINFEIWLYTNNASGLDFETFQGYLNKSTIKFLDGTPDYYINAFKDTEDNPQGKKDCDVNIHGDHYGQYGDAKISSHLNGSDINKVYKSKTCEGPEGEHDHDFLWK